MEQGKNVPFPATFTYLVNEAFGSRTTGLSLDILSPNPVNPDKVLSTPEDKEAFSFLSEFPERVFFRPMDKEGQLILYFYTSDRVTDETCISCHTKLVGGPLKQGDVLGVRKFEVFFSDNPELGRLELRPSLVEYDLATDVFQQTLMAMKNGGTYPEELTGTRLRITQGITDEAIQAEIHIVETEFSKVTRSVALLLKSKVGSTPYQTARRNIALQTQQLMVTSNNLVKKIYRKCHAAPVLDPRLRVGDGLGGRCYSLHGFVGVHERSQVRANAAD